MESELAEVSNRKLRTARKTHKCQECYKIILPSERYWYWSGICDSRPFDHKICKNCENLRDLLEALAMLYKYPKECFPPFTRIHEWRYDFENEEGVTIVEAIRAQIKKKFNIGD